MSHVEFGFLLPLDPPGPSTTMGGTYRLLRLPGIDQQLSVARVSLTNPRLSTRAERDLFVVSVYFPGSSDDAVAALAAVLSTHLPDADLVFIRQDYPGRAIATCTSNTSAERAGAAVAAIKTIGSLEEVNPMDIVVNGRTFEVVMIRSGNQWFARVGSLTA